MVPKQHHARIQGFNQMLGGGINIIAAPLGALLLEALPMQGVLGVDIVTAVIAVLPLLFVRIPQPQRRHESQVEAEKTSIWQDFRAGLRYIREWPGAIGLMVIAMLINMVLIPAFSLMPLLVTKHFGGQAIHLATLESATGIGIVLGGLALGVWGGFRRRVLTSLAGLVVLGLGCLTIGFTPASVFGIAVGAMFILGFASPLTNGPLLAIIQSTVEPEMQGRILTLIGSASAAVSPLGLIVAGPIADAFGVRTWFIAGGIITLLMGLAAFFIPSILHIEDGRHVMKASIQEQAQVVSGPAD
jgi:DHA3 family macrolide efflux protein-like MFS transporter